MLLKSQVLNVLSLISKVGIFYTTKMLWLTINITPMLFLPCTLNTFFLRIFVKCKNRKNIKSHMQFKLSNFHSAAATALNALIQSLNKRLPLSRYRIYSILFLFHMSRPPGLNGGLAFYTWIFENSTLNINQKKNMKMKSNYTV